MDLVEFLLARIAEDESVAQEASPGPWRVDNERYAEYVSDKDGLAVISGGRWGDEASVFTDTDDALHLVRWHPARVLAECEAKRRIVGEHHRSGVSCPTCSLGDEDGEVVYWRDPCPTLRLLALPYADHPDYRQEWRP